MVYCAITTLMKNENIAHHVDLTQIIKILRTEFAENNI